VEEDYVIFDDLDIWEAVSEAIKLIVIDDRNKRIRNRKYDYEAPGINIVRKFLYSMGRRNTKGLTKAWESLTGLMYVWRI